MKIKCIRLAAYGPFTDTSIDLSDSGSNFHILFGSNEAGKSSALRAIRHMFFGIPTRTADSFLHGYSSLRVGATLCRSNGEEITFLRRKGNAKTLRGPGDETALDDDALAFFLGGVGPDVFEQMFAIGHEDLIRGGEEIVSGKGSVGEAIFAAGAGLIRLQSIQKDLEQDCGTLFKPSGSTPSINQTIKSIKTARKNQKESLLLPKTWQIHDQDRREAITRLEKIKQRLKENQHREAKLKRIGEALPLIARKKEVDTDLTAYEGVPDLQDDFGEKRRDAERELKMATRDLHMYEEAIETIQKRLNSLELPVALLENAPTIARLQHELGSYRKALKDRPGLDGRMRTLQKQAAELLEEIDGELSGKAGIKIKIPPSIVGEIQQLGKAYERLTAKMESAADQCRKVKARVRQRTDQRKKISVPVDVACLENALQLVQDAGPIEKQLKETRTLVRTREADLDQSMKRLPLWNASEKDLDVLALPLEETIDRFEERFEKSRRGLEKHRESEKAAEGEVAQILTEIKEIDLTRKVPTENDLSTARTLRDKGWSLIRQNLEGKKPPIDETQAVLNHFDHDVTLPDAFEKSMSNADHISDRLRREADQVTRKGLLKARKEKFEKKRTDADSVVKEWLARRHFLEEEWIQLWASSGIRPQTPKEMRGWLVQVALLREQLSVLRSQKNQLESLFSQCTKLRTDLMRALEPAGSAVDESQSLSLIMKTAQIHIQSQKDLKSSIATADKELMRLNVELKEESSAIEVLEGTLSRWKSDWEKTVKKIGLGADISSTAALAVIESVREVKSKTSEAEVLRKRIAGIDQDCSTFTVRVDKLVELLAPELKKESQDSAAERLNGRLIAGRKDESEHQSLTDRLSSEKKSLADTQRRIVECNALIESLCQEARCTDTGSLAEMETRAQERKSLIGERRDLERKLRGLSAGATVGTFIDDASSMDADRITPDLFALVEENTRLETERSSLEQQIGALKATLAQMDGTSKAAEYAESAEHLLASLESDVEKYARLKVASVILSRTVEQYREKHQGPLIARASEFFTQMTLGSFSRLRADYDEKGNPVLVGIRRESEAPIHVSGMSDGTADQLYLALRLAGLEQYLEKNEPLPFIVDDILLRFDDARALATLQVLAGLSRKTQVLFFTHHQRLVELAETAKAPEFAFLLHHLGNY